MSILTPTDPMAPAPPTLRFLNSWEEELDAENVDPLLDSVRFGDAAPQPILALTPTERALVIAEMRGAERPMQVWTTRHLQDAIAEWTDTEVSERTGCPLALVPYLRVLQEAWHVAEAAGLANFLGIDLPRLMEQGHVDYGSGK